MSGSKKFLILIFVLFSIFFFAVTIELDLSEIPVEIKIKVMVDELLSKNCPNYKEDIESIIRIGSEYYKDYNINFTPKIFRTVPIDQFQLSVKKDRLCFLKNDIDSEGYDIVLVVAAQFPKISNSSYDIISSLFDAMACIGLVNKILGDEILLIKRSSEMSEVQIHRWAKIFSHEMGHLFEATHSPNEFSIMHAYFYPKQYYIDSESKRMILKNKFRFSQK